MILKYAGNFEYRQIAALNKLYRVALSEGQSVFRDNKLAFEYSLKDHLGNVRVVFDEEGQVLQKTDYYAFGLEIDRNSPIQTPAARNAVNRYNFLGKETQAATGYIDLQARFYDPLIGRFMQVDPVSELQESQSVYQYGWNNPILRSDPNGTYPDGPGDDPFLIARLAATAFFDTKHAIINTGARWFRSDIRAGYKVDGNGNQTFETQISRQAVDNSLSGQVREAVNAVGDVALLATAGSSPANPGNLLSKTSVESQVVKAGKEVASEITAYKRPSGSVTNAQRASVQGKPCVDCGTTGTKMVADHKRPLVKEHYETGTIDKKNMRSVDAVQPQCPTCSAKQGAEMSRYSREQKKKNGLD
ncbi:MULTISPECIES: RHS repeat domain-containing protein [Dyadobacter]|uniref:RHS repeat-associated core domain-containing protein n=1 Tax=Dyadobacter chenhuakuii TaxID=2909339 RepID=A0A9X1QIQ8_9BACT|nr:MULTISPECIES: RHS repeat-associated core domain-containing protein [Dyadobacter]MCF2500434.1 RHS repeat-associated core domain-containing protein [Dyadobacter chenhuakuii]MCF2516025.1 RHS repeat-associated core domain-containing protein [Dyadobacter sp. CY351]